MNRIDELTLKLADGELSDDEAVELQRLTADDHFENQFARLLVVEAGLQSTDRCSVADRVIEQLNRERCDRIEEGVMKEVATVAGRRRLTSWFWVAGTIAAGIVFAVFVFRHDSAATDQPIAKLVRYANDAHRSPANPLAGHSSRPRERSRGTTVHSGQVIEATEDVAIIYPDGTTIELLPGCIVTVRARSDEAKEMVVSAGTIQADVAKQPAGKPLTLLTSTAILEVLGTTLGVTAGEESTQLDVASGLVALTRKADGKRVDVAGGEFARATSSANDPIAAKAFPKIPSVWQLDFDAELPTGWRAGQLMGTDHGHVVQATLQPGADGFAITTHNAWEEGDHALFRLHEDSVLHFRMRQESFARIRLMVVTRQFPPRAGTFGANLFFTRKAWNDDLPQGEWRTISVPIAELDWYVRRGKQHAGVPEFDGLSAYMMQFSTGDRDVGLTIDRIWVTRGADDEI